MCYPTPSAPCAFPNTTQYISLATTQSSPDPNTRYVFQNWDNATTTLPRQVGPGLYTATFKTQYQLTITSPVNGTVTPASGGWYDAGAVVTLTATPNSGYQFANWSANVSGNSVTMNAPQTVTATFVPVGSISITTSPAGLPVTIDGTQCSSNCTAQAGLAHTISVTRTGTLSGDPAGKRYYFDHWPNSSNALQFQIPASGAASSYVATFRTQYQLTLTANPTTGGAVTASPTGTPDAGWYDAGTVVTLTPVPVAPNQFTGYSGASVSQTNTLTMNVAAAVTANFGVVTTVKEYIRLNGRVIAIEAK
jgi:hypothetical protein